MASLAQAPPEILGTRCGKMYKKSYDLLGVVLSVTLSYIELREFQELLLVAFIPYFYI